MEVSPADLKALRQGLSEIQDVAARLAAHPGRSDVAMPEPWGAGACLFSSASGSGGS